MKTNKVTLIAIFFILVITIIAVFILRPKTGPMNIVFNDIAHQNKVLVYFSKTQGNDVVTEPVVRDVPKPRPTSSQGVIEYAVSELFKGPTAKELKEGYYTEVPKGTHILYVEETPDKVVVNISQEFTTGGGSNSMIHRLQEVVKTIASVPQKKPVYLDVNGKQLETLGGEGVMVDEPVTKDPSVTQ